MDFSKSKDVYGEDWKTCPGKKTKTNVEKSNVANRTRKGNVEEDRNCPEQQKEESYGVLGGLRQPSKTGLPDGLF
jgi:hypothetical protein